MKAICLHNGKEHPHLDRIFKGHKTIETRVWRTKFRGEIILCATKKPDNKLGGHAVGVVEIYEVKKMTKEDEIPAMCPLFNGWSWFVRNVRKFDKPFPVKGKQRIFDLDIPEDVKLIPISKINCPPITVSECSQFQLKQENQSIGLWYLAQTVLVELGILQNEMFDIQDEIQRNTVKAIFHNNGLVLEAQANPLHYAEVKVWGMAWVYQKQESQGLVKLLEFNWRTELFTYFMLNEVQIVTANVKHIQPAKSVFRGSIHKQPRTLHFKPFTKK